MDNFIKKLEDKYEVEVQFTDDTQTILTITDDITQMELCLGRKSPSYYKDCLINVTPLLEEAPANYGCHINRFQTLLDMANDIQRFWNKVYGENPQYDFEL